MTNWRKSALRRSSLLVGVSLMIGCATTSSPLWNNPDRDLTDFGQKIPSAAKSMEQLRRIAVRRTDWDAPVSAARARELLVAGAQVCHQGWQREGNPVVGSMGISGGFVGGAVGGVLSEVVVARVDKIVEVAEWPELGAVAIGLGSAVTAFLGASHSKAFFVLYAVVATGAESSRIYAYNRGDSDVQLRFVKLAPVWLSGQTSVCELAPTKSR